MANVYLWNKMKSVNRFHVLPHLKKIVPAALGLGGIIWLLSLVNIHTLVVVALAPPIYLGLLYLLKEPLLKEIKLTLEPITNGEIQKF